MGAEQSRAEQRRWLACSSAGMANRSRPQPPSRQPHSRRLPPSPTPPTHLCALAHHPRLPGVASGALGAIAGAGASGGHRNAGRGGSGRRDGGASTRAVLAALEALAALVILLTALVARGALGLGVPGAHAGGTRAHGSGGLQATLAPVASACGTHASGGSAGSLVAGGLLWLGGLEGQS